MKENFNQFRNKFSRKKYKPLPAKEINQLVINNQSPELVASSMQRLIIKAISNTHSFETTSDAELFELFSVCNEALANSMKKYKDDRIDFAYYAYVMMINAMKSNYRINHVVKPSIIHGERMYASYFFMDIPRSSDDDDEDGREFDLEDDSKFKYELEIDEDFVFSLIKQQTPLFQRKYLQIFFEHLRTSKNNKEISLSYKVGHERVRQIIKDVGKEIRKNPLLLEHFGLD